MTYLLKRCPVPKSQQPLHEYNSLRDSLEFAWTKSNRTKFLQHIFLLFTILYFGWGILLFNTYSDTNFTAKQLLLIFDLSSLFMVLILVRYYSSWNYVYMRLMQSTIAYEESGWYDGQTWVKPTEVLLQDRLIGKYELLPILVRLKQFISLFILCGLLGLLLFEFIIK